MATMYMFRGVSATGKTTVSNALSEKYKIPVYRKDDIYDSISLNLDHKDKNIICYDALAKMIQTNLDLDNDIVVDIALPHRPNLDIFLSKINFNKKKLQSFFCVCSDKKVWKNRWQERIKNPTPNQLFMSIDEMEDYYSSMDFTLLEDEKVIDSIADLEKIINDIDPFFEVRL